MITYLHLYQKLTFIRMSPPQCHEIDVMTFDAECHEICFVGRKTNVMTLMSWDLENVMRFIFSWTGPMPGEIADCFFLFCRCNIINSANGHEAWGVEYSHAYEVVMSTVWFCLKPTRVKVIHFNCKEIKGKSSGYCRSFVLDIYNSKCMNI